HQSNRRDAVGDHDSKLVDRSRHWSALIAKEMDVHVRQARNEVFAPTIDLSCVGRNFLAHALVYRHDPACAKQDSPAPKDSLCSQGNDGNVFENKCSMRESPSRRLRISNRVRYQEKRQTNRDETHFEPPDNESNTHHALQGGWMTDDR